jgi:hypothetical protein
MSDDTMMPDNVYSDEGGLDAFPERIDFSEVEGGFDAIPAGTYKATITDYEFKQTEKGDNIGAWYINWEFTLDDFEQNGKTVTGRKQWTITSLLPKALFALKDLIKACGLDPEANYNIRELCPQLVGSPVLLTVGFGKGEYADRNRVNKVKAPGASSASGSLLP